MAIEHLEAQMWSSKGASNLAASTTHLAQEKRSSQNSCENERRPQGPAATISIRLEDEDDLQVCRAAHLALRLAVHLQVAVVAAAGTADAVARVISPGRVLAERMRRRKKDARGGEARIPTGGIEIV